MDKLLKMIQPKWEEAKKRKAANKVPGKAYVSASRGHLRKRSGRSGCL